MRVTGVNEIKGLLVNLAAGFLQTTIVIDAPDERDKGTREILVDILEDMMAVAKHPIKIFATSRDDGDLMMRLEKSPNVYIQEGENHKGITLFIDSEIDTFVRKGRLLGGVITQDLREKIVDTLKEKAHGMYVLTPELMEFLY